MNAITLDSGICLKKLFEGQGQRAGQRKVVNLDMTWWNRWRPMYAWGDPLLLPKKILAKVELMITISTTRQQNRRMTSNISLLYAVE
ncbi:unnamed protein product [Calypogeia fissa]